MGIILILVSIALFFILFTVPFWSLETKPKIAISTVLVVAAEVLFWGGTLLIGKDVYNKFKEKIKSGEWLNKKKENREHD